jgi:hypothetical protein
MWFTAPSLADIERTAKIVSDLETLAVKGKTQA